MKTFSVIATVRAECMSDCYEILEDMSDNSISSFDVEKVKEMVEIE